MTRPAHSAGEPEAGSRTAGRAGRGGHSHGPSASADRRYLPAALLLPAAFMAG